MKYQAESVTDPRKIRVLLAITALGTGGATNVVLDIADHLNGHPGFEVEILTGPIPDGRSDLTHVARERDITLHVVPSLVNQIDPFMNLKAVAAIRRILVQGEFDIVHTHSSVAGVTGRLAAFAAGTPVVVHHVHGWTLHEDMSGPSRQLRLNMERLCAVITDRIILVSSPDLVKARTYRICSSDKLTLIYNGIDLDKFRRPVNEEEMRRNLALEPDSKLVGMIGRLDEQKNPLDLIRTAEIVVKSYPDVQFLIVGDGQLRSECERLIEELHLAGKVILLGYRDDVAEIMPLLSITAMSSLWEGLPLAFLESMAAGKPIVANDVDGASDVVVDGETGFLVTARRPEEMADRILYLLSNEAARREMGRVAQERSADYSVGRMCGQIESVYRQLYDAALSSQTGARPPHAEQIGSGRGQEIG